MRRVLIGHRGAGKSQLLKRHEDYFSDVKHFDLDLEIEKRNNKSISALFENQGESKFRILELECYRLLVANNTSFVISLGAGFDLTNLDSEIEAVFVERSTDEDGRFFLNRPRLENQLSMLDEFKKRYQERQPKYIARANWIYFSPEGVKSPDTIEKSIFKNNFKIVRAYYTLTKQDLAIWANVKKCYSKIELRTDLLSSSEIENLLNENSDHDFLISIRNNNPINLNKAKFIDRDYLYYEPDCQILSSHADKIEIGIKQLAELGQNKHLKLCPLVENFEDLKIGYNWQQKDPDNRSFLPRSINGRWVWYRLLAIYFQKINFVKSFTRIKDQPSVYEYLVLPLEQPQSWAAILGSPVHFSRSPGRHREYFLSKKSFFSRIELGAAEFNNNLKWLFSLGLTRAAVTSPLKESLYNLAHEKSNAAERFKAANTFYTTEDKIFCHNTDYEGFVALVKNLAQNSKIAIWGGGGTLAMMKSVLPQAVLFSSQSGEAREMKNEHFTNFDYLIWAAPRSNTTLFPSDEIQVKHVIDLNYVENSMGLEFAALRKIGYTSGLYMFDIQAQEQQKYWTENEDFSERK